MNSSSFFTIAHLSDFHYDPHYAAGSSSDCIDFICCRNTSIVSSKSMKHDFMTFKLGTIQDNNNVFFSHQNHVSIQNHTA